jgi:SAM-dependent methyltransferase
MPHVDPLDQQALDAVRERIRAAKGRLEGADWYPYDSLASLAEAAALAAAGGVSLHALARDASVLELGAGDGHGSFLAETLGALHISAVDWPSTNFNRMQGITRLAGALGSKIEIRVEDVDRGFAFPGHRFNLCLALGILYHLKNPLAFLENIRNCSWHLLLSTAVVLPAQAEVLPTAYLVSEEEENFDATNYWLLTPRCLERLLARTGWEIVASTIAPEAGARAHFSNGRMFVFARARTLDPLAGLDAANGWHELEEGRYRWTERRFGFGAGVPSGRRALRVRMQALWPEVSLQRFGPASLELSVNGIQAGSASLVGAEPAWLEFRAELPVPCPPYARLEFALSRALPPEVNDPRERGIAVDTLLLDWDQ